MKEPKLNAVENKVNQENERDFEKIYYMESEAEGEILL